MPLSDMQPHHSSAMESSFLKYRDTPGLSTGESTIKQRSIDNVAHARRQDGVKRCLGRPSTLGPTSRASATSLHIKAPAHMWEYSATVTSLTSDCSAEASKRAADECHDALLLIDPVVDRRRIKGTRTPGTCEWITRNESYRAWLDSDGEGVDSTRLLWISGGPGKGKTMLSVFLTEELERHVARIDNAELVFFFCSAEDERRNTGVAVLRALIHRIIDKRPQLIKHALRHFKTDKRMRDTLESLETLWDIFSKIVADAELGTMFCVLDGLDECEESALRVLLPRIVSLLTGKSLLSTDGTFKLAIVSRDMSGLRGCTTRVKLDPDNDGKVVSDIELFVSTRVAELSGIEGFNDDFRLAVQTTLLAGAKGTFLWVGYAMHELSQKKTCSEIWEALQELPSGLPAIYNRMLLQIPGDKKDVSRAILRWVTMAVRPLRLQELAAAVGIQAPSLYITLDQAVCDAVALCGPLLKVQEQEVSLVHQSARDYLLRKERDSDAVLEAFRLNAESAHVELAQQCLDCVAQSFLQPEAIKLDTELVPQKSQLLCYATRHWPEHAKRAPPRDAALVHTLKQFFCDEHALRRHWWEAYRNKKLLSLPQPIPLLHMLCYLGFESVVEEHISWEGWKPRCLKRTNKKDTSGNTALHLAIEAQNHEVAKVLINSGADVDTRDSFRRTPLHQAAEQGDKYMVQRLVDGGADVNTIDMCGDSVLHSAIGPWKMSEMIVLILINKGADLDRKSSDESTVLHRAAKKGNEAVTRLLVEAGAAVNAKDKYGRTALHWAAEEGNEAAVRLLLEKGAVVNAKDKYGRTALHCAAGEVESMVVSLLASKGADVKARTEDGCTVLHEAVSALGGADRKNKELVELLISIGADSKAKNKDGKTALHLAIEKRNQAVVRMLRTEKWESKRRKTMAGRQQVRQRVRFLEALAHQ